MALRICRLAILILVVIWLVGRGFAGDASLPKAKQEAETKGYLFETRHDEIVAKAKKEGKLKVFSALDAQRTLRELSDRFKMKLSLKYNGKRKEDQKVTSASSWRFKRAWPKVGTPSRCAATFTVTMRPT